MELFGVLPSVAHLVVETSVRVVLDEYRCRFGLSQPLPYGRRQIISPIRYGSTEMGMSTVNKSMFSESGFFSLFLNSLL